MKTYLDWIKRQREYKAFGWVLGLAVLAAAGLTVEYILLGYGFLKILRNLVLVCGLFFTAWIDGHEKIIPNRILLILFCIRTIILLAECITYKELWMTFIASCLMGALMSGGMFLLCYFISRGAMGAGDIKLMAVLGYYIGGRFIFGTIFLIVMIAAVYNVIRLIFRKTSLKQEIPFAPFVLAGTLSMMVLGI